MGLVKEYFLTDAVAGRPFLLLVNNQSSHYDPDTIRFAKEHNVIIFYLPPHTTNEAQPFDISIMKNKWRDVINKILHSNPGKQVSEYNCKFSAKA